MALDRVLSGRSNASKDEERKSVGSDDRVAEPEKTYDPESASKKPRKRSITDDNASDEFSIGKQIEMESENAIKFRTCSWPKVCLTPLHIDRMDSIDLRSLCQSCYCNREDVNFPSRLPLCCSPNIFAWPSCLSHGRTRFSASFLA
jgi:hypothetical protein